MFSVVVVGLREGKSRKEVTRGEWHKSCKLGVGYERGIRYVLSFDIAANRIRGERKYISLLIRIHCVRNVVWNV